MFYGIGVGVGNSDMVTKRGIDVIKSLDILYVPTAKKNSHSVAHRIADKYIAEKTVIKDRHFPMNYNTVELQLVWNNIAKEIEEDVNAGKIVGFVTIGDPMVYSTYIYLLKILKDKIKIQTIPGITSFLDIASNHNFPLVEGDDPLLILPATMKHNRLENYIKNENSLVLMKVNKNYKEIIELLLKYELEDCCLVVSNSSSDNEIVYTNIKDVTDLDVSYFTTILINKKLKTRGK